MPAANDTGWLMLAALTAGAQSDAFAPLLGLWEGEWKITQGTVDIAGKFRVTFSSGTPAPEGRFMNLELIRTRLDGKPSTDKAKLDRREYKVEKLQSVETDPPRYRWFAAGKRDRLRRDFPFTWPAYNAAI